MAASKRLLVLLGLALLLSGVAGCARGPGAEVLKKELQYRLDTRFMQGLFSVQEFRRSGSAPFHDLQSGASGIYVYYEAELEFLQDYSLTDWKSLNISTLAFAIGATEAGISGFHAAGNSRGELLQVHGRFSYEPGDQGEWVSLDRKPAQALPRAGAVPGQDPEAILADARSLVGSAEEKTGDPRQAIIVEEMGRALNHIDLRMAHLEDKIILGSGPSQGTYHSFGAAFSRYATREGVEVYSARTDGSVENASRLQAGLFDFGLVQSDVAQIFYGGLREKGMLPNPELRAVASLWPEAVHLLTLAGSGIEALGDLRGRRVAIGRLGSGSRWNAILIGLATMSSPEDLPIISEIGLTRAIEQLEAGELDALLLTEAVPAPAIQALAARRDDLRFIPLPESLLERLESRRLGYYPLTVAARTYPGQSEPFTTLGLTAALLTHASVADERVEAVLRLLLTGGDALARNYYRAAFISRETVRLGLVVPLHPAAERYYQRMDQDSADERLLKRANDGGS